MIKSMGHGKVSIQKKPASSAIPNVLTLVHIGIDDR